MSLDKCLVQGLALTPLAETKTEHGAGKDDDQECLPEVSDSGL